MKMWILGSLLFVSQASLAQSLVVQQFSCEVRLQSVSSNKIAYTKAVIVDLVGVDEDFPEAVATDLVLLADPSQKLQLPAQFSSSVHVEESVEDSRDVVGAEGLRLTQNIQDARGVSVYNLVLKATRNQKGDSIRSYKAAITKSTYGAPNVLQYDADLSCYRTQAL